MPAIGHVTRTDDGGFRGQLRTLSIRAETEILPSDGKGREAQPDYRVLADGVEIGAGWNRRSESSGRDYVSLSLATPEFGPRRIYVDLVPAPARDGDGFALVWIPPTDRGRGAPSRGLGARSSTSPFSSLCAPAGTRHQWRHSGA